MSRRKKPKHAPRVLDLSAAQDPSSTAPKPLSDRQLAEYQRALLGLKKWLTKLRRATTEVTKHQSKITYYEKLQKVFPLR
jgi:hypothetical protein